MDDENADRTALRAAVFDAVPSQLAVLDTDGTIVETNRSWQSFGLDNGLEVDPEMIGENYLTTCRRAEDPTATEAVAGLTSVLEGDRETWSFEYPCHSPDERRWFTMRAIRFEHDGQTYVLVMHVDITERRLAELAVQHRNDTLEMVSGIISHDLRNPLSAALGRTELLADDDNTATIERSLERMNAIIEDALLLASQQGVDTVETVPLAAVAEAAWEQVETGDGVLVVDTEDSVPADRSLLAQLLENLFRNAVEHSPDERGSGVTVRVGPLPGGFYVEDDGVGIPRAEREQVFEPGYTTDKREGTGLGLAIVRHVADAHGWTVKVTGAADGGARFEVTGVV